MTWERSLVDQPITPTTAELDEQIEVAVGRRAPYTQLGDWVALSGIDDHAKALYWHLSMHINVERGDNEVWPSRPQLAEWCGFGKAESVDRYLAQLVDLGAVEVRVRRYAGGMRARNRYLIHQSPPAGYTGVTSLAEWYQRRRDTTTDAAAAPAARSPLQRTTARPAETQKTAGQPVVRCSGPRQSAAADPGSPLQRTGTQTKYNQNPSDDDERASARAIDPLVNGGPLLQALDEQLRAAGIEVSWSVDPEKLVVIEDLALSRGVERLVAAAERLVATVPEPPNYITAFLRRWRGLRPVRTQTPAARAVDATARTAELTDLATQLAAHAIRLDTAEGILRRRAREALAADGYPGDPTQPSARLDVDRMAVALASQRTPVST